MKPRLDVAQVGHRPVLRTAPLPLGRCGGLDQESIDSASSSPSSASSPSLSRGPVVLYRSSSQRAAPALAALLDQIDGEPIWRRTIRRKRTPAEDVVDDEPSLGVAGSTSKAPTGPSMMAH
jgi:hypothetical protein